MQKSTLVIVAGLSCLLLVGCGSKSAPTEVDGTGTVLSGEQVLTGTQSGEDLSDQNTSSREEITGEISNGSLTITGQIDDKTTTEISMTTSGKAVSDDVAKLIKDRAVKPKSSTGLTEDDIDLMDKTISFLENMFKK